MESSTTHAIVEHRLHPGTKLAEQRLADHFGVSRTLVRQALFQLSQYCLIRMEPARIKALKNHLALQKSAVTSDDVAGRTGLLGGFHARIAELTGHEVLAQILRELISRCALITLTYQSASAAEHASDEHTGIVKALAVQLMSGHLLHVEQNLAFERKLPGSDIAMALS